MHTKPELREIGPGTVPRDKRPVSLVVPVFNEEPNLAALAGAIVDALDGAEIPFEAILVNDGSTDGSAEVLDYLHEQDERFKIIHFVRNYGQTAAMSAGIQHASGDFIVTLDADLQNDPADIPGMLAVLEEGYDVACGWRRDRQDRLLDRRIPSILANRLISSLSKVHLHDYGCTLKACRRELLAEIPLYGQMHRFIPIYLVWAGARMVEVPVHHHPRRAGTSKYGLTRTFPVLLDLMTLKFLRDYYVNPIYFFGYFGFGSIFAGLAAAMAVPVLKVTAGTSMAENPLWLIAALCILLGFNAFFFGLIAEILIRMNFEIQHKTPYKIRSVTGELTPPGDT